MQTKTAYSELYLKDAQENIAWAFEYAVLGLKIPLQDFVDKWIAFEYINLIETGNPHFIAGMSGIELAQLVSGAKNRKIADLIYAPSVYYWIGFVVSYYQWKRNCTYAQIFNAVLPEEFLGMYKTFHEEDISNIVQAIDEKMGMPQ